MAKTIEKGGEGVSARDTDGAELTLKSTVVLEVAQVTHSHASKFDVVQFPLFVSVPHG